MKTKFFLLFFLFLPFFNQAQILLSIDYEYDAFSHGKPLNMRIEGIAIEIGWDLVNIEVPVSVEAIIKPGENNLVGITHPSHFISFFKELKFFVQDPFDLNHWNEVNALQNGKYYFSGTSRINLDYERPSSVKIYYYKLKYEMPCVYFKGSRYNIDDVKVEWQHSDMNWRDQINKPTDSIPDSYDCIVKANQTDTVYWTTIQEITNVHTHFFHIYIQGQKYNFYTKDLLKEGAIFLNNKWYIQFDPTDSDIENYYFSYIIGYDIHTQYDIQKNTQELEASHSFSVYPSPATDHINIGYKLEENTELTIYSMDGKVMERTVLDAGLNSTRIETPHYKSGMYMLRYGNETGKFIIK